MTMIKSRHIFFVDDESSVRKAVQGTLEGSGFTVTCFANAADCLDQLNSLKCDLLITDVMMPEMDGIELLSEIKRRAPWLPVLVITGNGNIPMAAQAFKKGTTDFIQKPLTRNVLLSTVDSILKSSCPPDLLLGKKITRAEMRILHMVIDGKTNSEIAYTLTRSVRTVEQHRRHIMEKLGVDNVVDLVKRALGMGLTEHLK